MNLDVRYARVLTLDREETESLLSAWLGEVAPGCDIDPTKAYIIANENLASRFKVRPHWFFGYYEPLPEAAIRSWCVEEGEDQDFQPWFDVEGRQLRAYVYHEDVSVDIPRRVVDTGIGGAHDEQITADLLQQALNELVIVARQIPTDIVLGQVAKVLGKRGVEYRVDAHRLILDDFEIESDGARRVMTITRKGETLGHVDICMELVHDDAHNAWCVDRVMKLVDRALAVDTDR